MQQGLSSTYQSREDTKAAQNAFKYRTIKKQCEKCFPFRELEIKLKKNVFDILTSRNQTRQDKTGRKKKQRNIL